MAIPTHAYCCNCEAIQPTFSEALHAVRTPGDAGSWLAGDLVCQVCAWIVATLYAPEAPVVIQQVPVARLKA